MSGANPRVLHLLTSDIDRGRAAVCRRLMAGAAPHHAAVLLGPGSMPSTAAPTKRLAIPGGWGRLATARLAWWLERYGLANIVLHAWTPHAAEIALPLVTTRRPLLVDWPPGSPGMHLRRWLKTAALALVCSAETTRAGLVAGGFPASGVIAVRPQPDAAELEAAAALREPLRREIGVRPNDRVATILPPALRASGAYYAGWAGLLVEKARRDLRVLVPAAGPAAERVRRLYVACAHGHMLRTAPSTWGTAELLAATDVAIFVPVGDVPVDALAAAVGRVPLVASDRPLVREIVGSGEAAWCAPGVPRSAARALLAAVEGQVSAGPPPRPCADGKAVFEEAYRRLAERRSVGGGLKASG